MNPQEAIQALHQLRKQQELVVAALRAVLANCEDTERQILFLLARLENK